VFEIWLNVKWIEKMLGNAQIGLHKKNVKNGANGHFQYSTNLKNSTVLESAHIRPAFFDFEFFFFELKLVLPPFNKFNSKFQILLK